MAINSPAITCDCENDPRLLAGIAAVARHVAKHANWNSEAQDKLGQTTENMCRKVFRLARENGEKTPAIRLICAPFQDRIEVSVEFSGELSAEALGSKNGDVLAEGGVRYETINGRSRLTLLCHDCASSKPKV